MPNVAKTYCISGIANIDRKDKEQVKRESNKTTWLTHVVERKRHHEDIGRDKLCKRENLKINEKDNLTSNK